MTNIAHFGPALVVGHWHNDMPGMRRRQRLLAASEGCRDKLWKYGDRVYGFQCHMEFDAEVIERLITHSQENEAAKAGVLSIHTGDAQLGLSQMNQKLWTFLDNLVTHCQH